MIFDKEWSLLQNIKALNDDAFQHIVGFVLADESVELAREYETCLKKRKNVPCFSLFEMVSDLYYRENFHSDILRALLDPNSPHQERGKYLDLFLEFLSNIGAHLNPSDYKNACVVREEGRIDILIKDADSKRAIIIENKINRALDMPKQVPRYLQDVRMKGYSCDAIVYLRLAGYTGPDTTGWTQDEQKQVSELLHIVRAYDDTETDLLRGWISKCERASENPDAGHIFRQYGSLLKKLGGNVMNKQIIGKFHQMMIEGENFKTALSLKSMLDDLVGYRVDLIVERFIEDKAPFTKIDNYKNEDAIFHGLILGDAHYGIDVIVKPDHYQFWFWDRNDEAGINGCAKAMLQKLNVLDEYKFDDGKFTKNFEFPSQEGSLFAYIATFKKKLNEISEVSEVTSVNLAK